MKKTELTAKIEEVLANNMKAGLFVGLDKNDIEPEAYGTMMGDTDDIALALYAVSMNQDNQIYAKTLRDAIFKAAIHIASASQATTQEFMKMCKEILEQYEQD